MYELLRNVEKRLKEKGKTKRELAKLLGIKENSVNRTLKNPKITLLKLGVIADFFEIDIADLLPKKNRLREPEEGYQKINDSETTIELAINKLSDALSRSIKTNEDLFRIITEKLPEKKD